MISENKKAYIARWKKEHITTVNIYLNKDVDSDIEVLNILSRVKELNPLGQGVYIKEAIRQYAASHPEVLK